MIESLMHSFLLKNKSIPGINFSLGRENCAYISMQSSLSPTAAEKKQVWNSEFKGKLLD